MTKILIKPTTLVKTDVELLRDLNTRVEILEESLKEFKIEVVNFTRKEVIELREEIKKLRK